MPYISVCLATYNGSQFIKDQLLSILTQLDQNDEIIISDDFSTDDTVKIINELNDNRIKLVYPEKKSGPVYNFENALKYAKGDFVFLSDQDDIWMLSKVEEQIKYLQYYDLVLSDAFVVDENCELIYPSFFKLNFSGKGFLRNWVNNSFMGCCMAFNRKILEYVLPFPKGLAMHDSWIGLNASLIGKCILVDKQLIKYRRHGSNTVSSFKKNHLPVWYQISYRVHLILHIINRYYKKYK